MAPSPNPARALQQNRPRPRAIVPAIPLPYIQKRKQQDAARAKAKEDAARVEVEVEDEKPPTPTPPTTEILETANGFSDHASEKSEDNTTPASPETPDTPAIEEELAEPAAKETVVESHVQENASENATEEPQEDIKSPPSDVQSSASRSTYQMPPPFVPSSNLQTMTNVANQEPPKFPPPHFNGPHAMHHAHPSNGSLVFGGYPESNNSSPAPPANASNMPPYPFPQPQLMAPRHGPHQSNGGQSQHMANGYSPMGPPPGYHPRQDNFMSQGPGADFARRQIMPYGPPEGYSPINQVGDNLRMNSYDIPGQHSFAGGSQSSAPNEQDNPAYYGQYPTAVISNGSNGHIDEVRLYQQPRPKPRTGSQPLNPVPNAFPGLLPGQALPMDHLDGLVGYLQSQFADASFADYTLELRYADDRAPPVRIPGHNLIFARSPTLKNLMVTHSDGSSVRILLIESDDRFLRSDAFWMAVQRLYGGQLLDLGAHATLNAAASAQANAQMPGTPADRFQLALGYAAAGKVLEIPPVIARGIEIASHFVSWVTVEKAFDFALEGGLDSQWTLQNQHDEDRPTSIYGPAVNMLIHSGLNFIITSFPAGFKLDTTVEEPATNPRLPAIKEDRPSAPNPRLSFIKFGDHPSEESVRSTSGTGVTVTLSKILLNLPFHLLKYVLESPRLGNVQGWATTTLRQEVMHSVVEEREKRRSKARSSSVSNPERITNAKDWDAVGWQEAVEPLGGNEATPTLNRIWVGFVGLED